MRVKELYIQVDWFSVQKLNVLSQVLKLSHQHIEMLNLAPKLGQTKYSANSTDSVEF